MKIVDWYGRKSMLVQGLIDLALGVAGMFLVLLTFMYSVAL